tara:strand:- start:7820 stop:8101 length:282 start_codon:yes stop_codon:yes gene_type:complete
MKLDAVKFGIASALAFAVLWIICSIFVWIGPGMMMEMSGHMVHGDLSQMQWQISFSGVIIGLIIWSVMAGITGGLIVAFYNRLTTSKNDEVLT